MGDPLKSPQATPAPPASLKKSTSGSQSSKNQSSIASFFSKKPAEPPANGNPMNNGLLSRVNGCSEKNGGKKLSGGSSQSLTPAPSSDAVEEDAQLAEAKVEKRFAKPSGLPSPITPATENISQVNGHKVPQAFYSPSRKVSI